MNIYIGIEDIAANAFIEVSKNSCTRELSFNTLNNYSSKILKILNSESQQATLKISYEETQKIFIEYSDFFEPYSHGDTTGIMLKTNISTKQLWQQFRSYLSTDVMQAFMAPESIAVLKTQE